VPEITYGRWSPTEVMERVLDGTWVIADDADATDAALMMVPTSIAYTGTSATTTASGSVEFTACSSVSLNGVFTGDFDNYIIAIRNVGSTDGDIYGRLRSAGSDSTATNYTYQYLAADSTTISGARAPLSRFIFGGFSSTQRDGLNVNVFGPYLAQPTAVRSTTIWGKNNAFIYDNAGMHSLSSSYDGITIYPNTGNLTGLISVYGIRGA
jgi:hypothetical protein